MKYVVKDHTEQKLYEFSWFKEAQEFFYNYRHNNSMNHITLLKSVWDSTEEGTVIATYYPD